MRWGPPTTHPPHLTRPNMTSGAVVVIPARGGSTRIPGKSIKAFNGKPMIAWPILAARESTEVNSVVVSTDAEEIAGLARELGASVPFVRPVHLADDHAGTAPVILHALDALELTDDVLVVCLYPHRRCDKHTHRFDNSEGLGSP